MRSSGKTALKGPAVRIIESRPFRAALILFLSGAAGVIYEAIWSRFLGLIVGHTAYAQVIVLATFLGGIAMGSFGIQRLDPRVSRPMLWYATIEAVLAVCALIFTPTYLGVARWLADIALPTLGPGGSSRALTWIVCVLLILPQAILLGGTFPLVARWVAAPSKSGGRVATLYAANSIGGAVGVILCGFLFAPRWGLPGAIRAGALFNLAAAMLALLWGRKQAAAQGADHGPIQSEYAAMGSMYSFLLVVAFGTAATSFLYEIAWVRMTALLLGSSTHAFELMLAAFITGIGIGSAWVARARRGVIRGTAMLIAAQVGMGVSALVCTVLYMSSFSGMSLLATELPRTESYYGMYSFVRYILCLVLMLPISVCAGATFPLIIRIADAIRPSRTTVAHMYGINTVGSIIGVVVGGLALLPLTGLRNLILLAGVVDIGLGLLLLGTPGLGARHARKLTKVLAVGAAAAVVLCMPFAWDVARLTSGTFRDGTIRSRINTEVLHYEDGRTATISVARPRHGSAKRWIASNGKPEGSLLEARLSDTASRLEGFDGDEITQVMLPIIGLLHRPDAGHVGIIGFGSGVSTHVSLTSKRVRNVTTIEIEPAVVHAGKMFRPANERAYSDSRSKVVYADARSYLAESRPDFDLIVSEPSNPWVSGVSSLFTVEFYRSVKARLGQHGVFTQWMHLYEMNDDLLLSVLGAIAEVFPRYRIYEIGWGDIAIVTGNHPDLVQADWTALQDSLLADPLLVSLRKHLDVSRLLLVKDSTLAPLLRGVTVNRDLHSYLEGEGEKARFLGHGATLLTALTNHLIDVPAALEGRGVDTIAAGDTSSTFLPRPRSALRGLELREAMNGAPGALRPDSDSVTLGALRPSAAPATSAQWHVWLDRTWTSSRRLHAGTVGFADGRFYGLVDSVLAANAAPAEIGLQLRFLHALQAHEFTRAGVIGDSLLVIPEKLMVTGQRNLIVEALVLSKLMSGDTLGAEGIGRLPRNGSSRVMRLLLGRAGQSTRAIRAVR